jgi:hypothetical protein
LWAAEIGKLVRRRVEGNGGGDLEAPDNGRAVQDLQDIGLALFREGNFGELPIVPAEPGAPDPGNLDPAALRLPRRRTGASGVRATLPVAAASSM